MRLISEQNGNLTNYGEVTLILFENKFLISVREYLVFTRTLIFLNRIIVQKR